MNIKFYRACTPGTRNRSVSLFRQVSLLDDATLLVPPKSLTTTLKKTAGRNNQGRMTSRHRGGGHKRLYRKIDFKRTKLNVPATVLSIQYDPNRNARIALLQYKDGDVRFILQPHGLKPGDELIASPLAPRSVGNALPLQNMPLGAQIHNIEVHPRTTRFLHQLGYSHDLLPDQHQRCHPGYTGETLINLKGSRGGQLVRAAGTVAQILAKEGTQVTVRLPSGEVRLFSQNCWATLGQVGNAQALTLRIGKAGRSRWLGKRPHVRGSAMNAVDHTHGGGEGRAPIGRKRPSTPWGKSAIGTKTRSRKKYSQSFIVRHRTSS